MAKLIQYRDPDSAEMKKALAELETTPGTCFFFDIVQSTGLKYQVPVSDWGRRLNNTFAFISFLNDFPDNIVKGIGDEIMLFIPDEVLRSKPAYNNYFALIEEIYATLYNIRHYPIPDVFLRCKVAIHYCTEVYNITYFRGTNDYYGSDIDLTARLMSKAKENRIVLSEKFHEKVQEDLKALGLPPGAGCLANISGTFIDQFRGIPTTTPFRIIDVK